MNIETAFDLLRHPRRRAVVSILDETDSITRRELVARLAAADAETSDVEASDIETKDVENETEGDARAIDIELQHNHLPRLADAGVVEYDGDTVTATPQLETVVEYATVVEEEPASTRYRLGARLSRFYA